MRIVTINEGAAGEVAINLDFVIHARLYPGPEGALHMHFVGADEVSIKSGDAKRVWAALTITDDTTL